MLYVSAGENRKSRRKTIASAAAAKEKRNVRKSSVETSLRAVFTSTNVAPHTHAMKTSERSALIVEGRASTVTGGVMLRGWPVSARGAREPSPAECVSSRARGLRHETTPEACARRLLGHRLRSKSRAIQATTEYSRPSRNSPGENGCRDKRPQPESFAIAANRRSAVRLDAIRSP